ncbi:DUF397 domain-containing protein [Nonomuraea longicatena]|uniref:DUF397 domain-containing protein n=1 Tax=Nonomuraea longicatena TaxID=83682 RepID=A0ABN1NPK9_9ACTN
MDAQNVTIADLSRAAWKKSSRSGSNGGQCVEVATNLPGIVAVRDSKNPGGPALIFTPGEWSAFIGGVMDGEFGNP